MVPSAWPLQLMSVAVTLTTGGAMLSTVKFSVAWQPDWSDTTSMYKPLGNPDIFELPEPVLHE
jgi:hypothetical protein